MSCDPNWSSVVLLLPLNGNADDSSNVANPPFTLLSAASYVSSPANPVGLAESLESPYSSPLPSVVYSAPFIAGSVFDLSIVSAWTVEGWIYATATASFVQQLLTIGEEISGQLSGLLIGSDGSGNATLNVNAFNTSVSVVSGFTAATWHHFAAEARPNATHPGYVNLQIFIDGVGSGWTPDSALYALTPIAGHVTLNGYYDADTSAFVGGAGGSPNYFSDIRITSGVTRYSTNFTPPVAAFPTVSCTATVPDVLGLLDAIAQADIIAAGLIVGTVTTVASASPPTTVLSQSPIGGTVTPFGSPVNLTESAGVLVPNVENLSEALAIAAIQAAGFVLGDVTVIDDVLIIPGNVVLQSPLGGTYATAGSSISLEISQGRAAVQVPDLIGLSEADALTALANLGLLPGAIGIAASTTVPAGIVLSQNIGPGIPFPIWIAVGSLVGFVVSSGPPPTDTLFNYEPTVISQYANSPTLLKLIDNMNEYCDQSANFANFLTYVWNVDTAQGFGLDILGRIVKVSRLLQIPNTTPYVGFDIPPQVYPSQDWQTMADNRGPTLGGDGAMYTGHNATQAYLLSDNSYRQLILAKAFANIAATTVPALNQLLQILYGVGQAYVQSTGVMAMSFNLNFTPTPIQLAILQQSGVIPVPPGVAFTIVTP
jgi:beta-lactam-binding protein with PASTA domain